MTFSRFIAARLSAQSHRTFTRTIIRVAVAAVAISIAVMIVTNALVSGFKREISEKVYGFWGHINITDIRADDSYESLPVAYDADLVESIRNIAWVEVDYGPVGGGPIRSRAGVRHVQAVAHIPGVIDTREQIEGIVVKGVDSTFNWSVMDKFLDSGEVLTRGETSSGMLISRYTANRLKVDVGDRFIVHFLRNDRQVQRRFEVEGIYRTGLEDYDKKFALAPLSAVRDLLGWEEDEVASYEVFVEHVDDAQLINDYIYLEELPATLFAQTIRSRFPNIFEWLELQDLNQYVILALTLAVAIINMISVLLILILERTRMIGLLKALGSRTWPVQQVFLYHAGTIILQGLAVGNVLGLGLCWLQKTFRFIKLNETDYYLSYAPVDINWLHILVINAGAAVLIMLFLVLPSLLVARIQPVKILQFR